MDGCLSVMPDDVSGLNTYRPFPFTPPSLPDLSSLSNCSGLHTLSTVWEFQTIHLVGLLGVLRRRCDNDQPALLLYPIHRWRGFNGVLSSHRSNPFLCHYLRPFLICFRRLVFTFRLLGLTLGKLANKRGLKLSPGFDHE